MACAGCHRKLGNRFFKLDSRYFHHDCFVCKTCGVSLKGGYFESGENVYCQTHIAEVSRATVSGRTAGYEPDESTETKKCSVCRGFLRTDPYVVVEQELVHTKCYKCTACGKSLSKQPYFYHGPGIYLCEKDNVWAKGQDDREWMCATCHKVLDDSVIICRGKKYHTGCMKCSTKGCKESGKYVLLDDTYCETHKPEGAEISSRIDRKSTVSSRRPDDEDVPLAARPSRPVARADLLKVTPRLHKDTTVSESRDAGKPTHPFATRDERPAGSIALPPPSSRESVASSVLPPPASSRETIASRPSEAPARKPVVAKKQPEPEPEPEPARDPKDDEDSENEGADDEPEAEKPAKKEKEEPKEDPRQLFEDEPEEEEQEEEDTKRGTPAAARKQVNAAKEAKAKLKDKLGDDAPKYKPSYKVTVNPDGSKKTELDLLEAHSKKAAEKEKRTKEKVEQEKEADRQKKT